MFSFQVFASSCVTFMPLEVPIYITAWKVKVVDVPVGEFICIVCTHMPGESYHM